MGIIRNEKCPVCHANGHDKTGNHLLVFSDGGKYCSRAEFHSSGVGYYVSSDGSEMDSTDMEEVSVSITTKMPNNLPYRTSGRMIDARVLKLYEVRKACSLSTGEDTAYYYPYYNQQGVWSGCKIRTLPKNFRAIGKIKDSMLFGQQVKSHSKKLLITGGEEDAMAAFQMLTEKYPKYIPAVVSLPNGESVSGLITNMEYIKSFDEVLISMDNDTVGKKACKEICDLLGENVSVVTLPLKDANEMLMGGHGTDFVSAYFNAQPFAPDGFVTVDDIWDEATAMPVWGKRYPWESLTKMTFGRRLGEGAYFGAGVKVGKSEAVNQLAHHITQVEGGKVALFKLEEKPAMTARKIAGKIMHKQFHIPDGDFTQAQLEEGVNRVRDGVVMYDNYGSVSWDTLKVAIRHAVLVEGCQDIIIDPLTRLTVGMNSADANTELERVADEISTMAKDIGFFYMFFCHLKAPQTGRPHEEGGKVHSNQFTGSRAMMRACYYMIGIERDKTLEDDVEKNTSHFVLLEDRSFGNSGKFDVFYNKDTGDYLEPVRRYQDKGVKF